MPAPTPRWSTTGRIAFSASVSGLKSGSAASGVSQASRQERAASRRTLRVISVGSPLSSPSESTGAISPSARSMSLWRRESVSRVSRVPKEKVSTAGSVWVSAWAKRR